MKTRRVHSRQGRRSIDASVLTGAKVHIDHPDGSQTVYPPLNPPNDTVVAVRVRYRCGACAELTAEVHHYDAANGTEVVAFYGRGTEVVRGERSGCTHYALIEPDYGTPPVCECPEHGPLQVNAKQVRRDVARSIAVELGQTRDEKERATRTVKLKPEGALGAS